ncbi:MAG: 50S ribosomal protein L15 [Candidatus Omnitrophota bacterium]|nr:50S ribosomal protein L15 [Candidatus Omnitrophota bacterium]
MRPKVPYEKKKKRLGRGTGSGTGKTGGRGQKGQGSRSGVALTAGFEGGQNPIYRRLPKRGFSRARFREEFAVVNLETLRKLEGIEITPEVLLERGVIHKLEAGLKILGQGEPLKSMTVKAHRFSKSAVDKITKAGGQAIVIAAKKEQAPKKK